jgi:hypothetical protein
MNAIFCQVAPGVGFEEAVAPHHQEFVFVDSGNFDFSVLFL